MTIKKLILTRGIPGSGKSTWAKAWVDEDPEHRIRLNWDDMRNMMGPYWVPSREAINKQMLWTALKTAAYNDAPYDVVIDNMNLNPKDLIIVTGGFPTNIGDNSTNFLKIEQI